MNQSQIWRTGSICALVAVVTVIRPLEIRGQTTGEVVAAALTGSQPGFRLTGLLAGGGLLFRNRFGVGFETGLLGDNSDERVVSPLFGVTGRAQLLVGPVVVPFVTTGFTCVGDWGGWHAGGGVDIPLAPLPAIRIEFRRTEPAVDFSGCQNNERSLCKLPSATWFVIAGMAFRFGR
jgi:hypothetical protein